MSMIKHYVELLGGITMSGSFIIRIVTLCLALCLTSSCSGSGDSSRGTLSLSLSDAPAPEYQAVYVTIAEIQVHRADSAEGDWISILTPDATFNLLELINGSLDPVGDAGLESGTYTQMRIILGKTPDSEQNILGHAHPYANYLVTAAGTEQELKVPGAYQSGIKILHTFTVDPGLTTDLVLDFDALRSVVRAGRSGRWLLKPVMKTVDALGSASLSGSVTDPDRNAFSGVTLSAQVSDPSSPTLFGRVTSSASTMTDELGSFLTFVDPGTRLDPGTYTVVAYADGYSAACRKITVPYAMDYPLDFTLTPAPMGTITCTLALPSGQDDVSATIEFRQTSPCDPSTQITIKTVNYSEKGSYPVSLPAGAYTVVASCCGQERSVEGVQTGDTAAVSF